MSSLRYIIQQPLANFSLSVCSFYYTSFSFVVCFSISPFRICVPDPKPHQFADDKPKCMEYKPIEYRFFQSFSFYLEARIRIRILIKVKGRIRIRIKVTSRIRIRNPIKWGDADPQHWIRVCLHGTLKFLLSSVIKTWAWIRIHQKAWFNTGYPDSMNMDHYKALQSNIFNL